MLNLMKRDISVQKGLMLLYIPTILFLAFMNFNTVLLVAFAMIYIPFNAIIYDSQVSTNMLLNSLPYKRSDIIAARYIGTIFQGLLCVLIALPFLYLFNVPFTWGQLIFGVTLSLFFMAFSYPVMYAFDSKYLSTIILFVFAFSLALAQPFFHLFKKYFQDIFVQLMSLGQTQLMLYFIGMTLIIYCISWFVTLQFYKRRVF